MLVDTLAIYKGLAAKVYMPSDGIDFFMVHQGKETLLGKLDIDVKYDQITFSGMSDHHDLIRETIGDEVDYNVIIENAEAVKMYHNVIIKFDKVIIFKKVTP